MVSISTEEMPIDRFDFDGVVGPVVDKSSLKLEVKDESKVSKPKWLTVNEGVEKERKNRRGYLTTRQRWRLLFLSWSMALLFLVVKAIDCCLPSLARGFNFLCSVFGAAAAEPIISSISITLVGSVYGGWGGPPFRRLDLFIYFPCISCISLLLVFLYVWTWFLPPSIQILTKKPNWSKQKRIRTMTREDKISDLQMSLPFALAFKCFNLNKVYNSTNYKIMSEADTKPPDLTWLAMLNVEPDWTFIWFATFANEKAVL